MSNKVVLHYVPDYDAGKAEAGFGPELFAGRPDRYRPVLAQLAAAIAAVSCDRVGRPGEARYLAPALAEDLQMQDISLYSYNRCAYDKTKVKTEKLGRNQQAFAFSLSHRPMRGEKEEFELILITLRGTETVSESLIHDFWGTVGNLRAENWHGYPTYRPFVLFAKKVLTGLSRYLKRHEKNWQGQKLKYLIIGYSLGGAAAQLISARLTDFGQTVFAYTFGSLNALTEDGRNRYPNIWNIFNAYDSYGPEGFGALGFRPAGGRRTMYHKFGHVLVFRRDYTKVFPRWAAVKNHRMPGYYHAVKAINAGLRKSSSYRSDKRSFA